MGPPVIYMERSIPSGCFFSDGRSACPVQMEKKGTVLELKSRLSGIKVATGRVNLSSGDAVRRDFSEEVPRARGALHGDRHHAHHEYPRRHEPRELRVRRLPAGVARRPPT